MSIVASGDVFTAVMTTVGLASLTAVVATFRDRKPVKWIVDRLFVDPAEEVVDKIAMKAAREVVSEQIKGVSEEVNRIGARVDSIFYEMHPNGGESLRDAVNRTEAAVSAGVDDIARLDQRVDTTSERVVRLEGAVSVLSNR